MQESTLRLSYISLHVFAFVHRHIRLVTEFNNGMTSKVTISPIDISVNLHIGILGFLVNKLLNVQKLSAVKKIENGFYSLESSLYLFFYLYFFSQHVQ